MLNLVKLLKIVGSVNYKRCNIHLLHLTQKTSHFQLKNID